jgi:hypothetical protein
VKVKGTPKAGALDRLRGGMVIDGRRATVLEVEPKTDVSGPRPAVQSSWWTVVLGEGRNRQLREMFHRIGHPVRRLRRVAIGPVKDPHLPPGALRELDEREVEALRQARPANKERPAKARRAKEGPAKARRAKEGPAKGKGQPSRRSGGDGTKGGRKTGGGSRAGSGGRPGQGRGRRGSGRGGRRG